MLWAEEKEMERNEEIVVFREKWRTTENSCRR